MRIINVIGQFIETPVVPVQRKKMHFRFVLHLETILKTKKLLHIFHGVNLLICQKPQI